MSGPAMSPYHDAESFAPTVTDRETDFDTLVNFYDPMQYDEIDVYQFGRRDFVEVDPYAP